MGCNVSKLDVNNGTRSFPGSRLLPLFVQSLEEMKARRLARRSRSPLKDATPSKKQLLYHGEDINRRSSNFSNAASSHEHSIKKLAKGNEDLEKETPKKGISIATAIGNDYGLKVVIKETKERPRDVATKQDIFLDAYEDDRGGDDDDDNDDDDDGRRIGNEAFPGSPSFRIYFQDAVEDSHNEIGENDAFKETVSIGDLVSPKESSMDKKMKRGKKKRSLRKVLPKRGQAAVKNILNLKSCCSPSHHQKHSHPIMATPAPT